MGLFGDSQSTKSLPLTSKTQRAVEKETGAGFENLLDLTNQNIGQAKSSLPGIQSAKIQALVNLLSNNADIRNVFLKGMEGEKTFSFDPDSFESGVATPIMQSFNQNIAPMLREQFAFSGNTPGSFYSSNAAEGVGIAANEFYKTNVLPALLNQLNQDFQAGESAAGRTLSSAISLAQLPGQEASTISTLEGSTMQNILAQLNAAGQFGTTPTRENVITQSSSPFGDIAQGALGIGMLASSGGFSGLGSKPAGFANL